MTDFYLKAAGSALGQSVLQALNLPSPASLKRTPADCPALPDGNYLVAGNAKAFCLGSVLSVLTEASAAGIDTARQIDFFEGATIHFCKRPKAYQQAPLISKINEIEDAIYDAILFDATGADTFDLLSSVYEFFHSAMRGLNACGKVLILAQQSQHLEDPKAAAIQESLSGFCKSLAKEYGKKGITCNTLNIQKGAQKYLESSLYFFLSPKSAFVSGQNVKLSNNSTKQSPSMPSRPLTGKTALVTGAAQGIGRETANILARDGATVICLDIPQNEAVINALADAIGGLSIALNLLNEDAVAQLCQTLSDTGSTIDILVHNAGITRDKTLARMTKDRWDQVLSLNFERVVEINQAFIEQSLLSEQARIICISSISGIAGNFGQTNYACSKAGIAAYVEAFARSSTAKNTNGFTINAIAPGFIETKMTESVPFLTREAGRRMNALSQGGLPVDIAEAVSYFSHPGSHGLNGNVLRVCGLSLLGK
jgi:3-oxoacyl-[acyl-carrier protein] reductase